MKLFDLSVFKRGFRHEVGEQRGDVAAESLLQERAAFLAHALPAGDGGPVDVPRPVHLVLESTFLDEPCQERANGAVIPAVGGLEAV